MNFKKFISGVSAFAIAASAFAGMAVTASAATKAVTKYTLPTAVAGALASENPNWNPGSTDIDFGTAVSSITSGVIYIDYQTNVSVDFTNGTGNRPGYITLNGLNDSSEAITVLDYYSNTSKSTNKAMRNNYAIGGRVVDNATKTSFAYNDTSTKTYNFSLAIDLDNNTISGTITGEGSDTAAATIPETTLEVSAITGFNLGSTTNNVQTVNSATVYVKEDVEYSITTKPYAKVTIGDAVTYSNATGVVDLTGVSLADGQTITVEKTGYLKATDTVDLDNVAVIDLTPNTGITYQEDFTYVYDKFGFVAGNGATDNTSVTNGKLMPKVSGGSTSTVFASPINISDKSIVLDMDLTSRSGNNYGDLKLDGIDYKFNVRPGYGLRIYYGSNAGSFITKTIDGTENKNYYISGRHTFTVKFTNGRAKLYTDGLYLCDGAISSTSFTGLTETVGKGSDVYSQIYSIKVADSAADVSVKIGDADAVTYLAGSTVTIPAAADGYEWQDAEGNVVAAGEIVVNNNLTLTAVSAATPHAEAFTFEKTAAELGENAQVKVVFQNDSTNTTWDYSEALGTEFSGLGSANIAVVITGIAEGYSVKSVTIE